MGAEQQQSTDDDFECNQRDRRTEAEDYRTTDLLDRAAAIKSELGKNIDKLWEGLDSSLGKTHPIIDDKPESINEDIRINQPASEPPKTAKNHHRER